MPTQRDPSVTYYRPGASCFQADGSLVMRASGWEGDIHWSGEHRVAPDDLDFALWCWLREGFRAASPGAQSYCTEGDLPFAREEYRRQHPSATDAA